MSTVVTQSGFAKPFDADGQPYPRFEQNIPALRSFYLAYGVGDSTPPDRHSALIEILPGGQSEDLSPNADLSPSNIPDGRLHVGLQDKNPGGENFFFETSHALLSIPGARRFQVRDVGSTGLAVRKLSIPKSGPVFPSYVFALVGFKLFFTGGRDHHLDRIGVWFRGNDELHVAMRDKNGDDVFGYLVDFIAIPTPLAGFNLSTGIRRGNARGGERISVPRPPNTNFLLTGWAFNFVRSDHHIRDLGVLRRGDNIDLFYGDKNADDLFDWRVEWMHLGQMVLAPSSSTISV
ncbi:MAG: hypothetical protein ACI8ZB_005487 [Desulforhopalus sp.]|jgi:hypothetical protein